MKFLVIGSGRSALNLAFRRLYDFLYNIFGTSSALLDLYSKETEFDKVDSG